MRSIACGLPPAKALPEPEIRGVFHEMMSAWEKEARRFEGKDLQDEAGQLRKVIAGVKFLHPKLEFQTEISTFVRRELGKAV